MKIRISVVIILVGLSAKNSVVESRKIEDDLVHREAAAARRRMAEVRQFLFPLPEQQWQQLQRHWASLLIPVHAESALCRNHSQRLLQGFMDGEVWAMRMVDASSKLGLQSGILDGHLHNMGNFAQCVSVEEPSNMFKGQHCILETSGILPKEIAEIVVFKGLSSFRQDGMFSVCVPSSCSDRDINSHADVGLAALGARSRSYLDEWGLTTDIQTISCSTAEGLPFRTKDYCAMMVLASLAVIVILATTTSAKSGWLSCFNARANFRELMDCRTRPEDITCLNGLRVLCVMNVILAHKMVLVPGLPYKHIWTVHKAFDTYAMAWLELYVIRSLDVFFLLGGLTFSYNFFLRIQRKEDFNYPSYIFKRYFRVTPVLAVAVLVRSTLMIHLSQGPIWKSSLAPFEEVCHKNWWTTLLHISNIVNPAQTCVGESWYVACDFQLQSLAPFLLLLILRRPRSGLLVLSLCFVVFSFAWIAVAFYFEVSSGVFVLVVFWDRLCEAMVGLIYLGPFFRGICYLMGLVLGYSIFQAKRVKGYSNLSKSTVWFGWVTTVAVYIGLFLVNMEVVSPDHQYMPVLDPLFVGLSRQTYCACVAWLIFACHFGYGGIINRFLSHPVFIPLAKLGFSVLFTHNYLHALQLINSQSAITVRYTEQLFLFFGEIMANFILAAIVYTTIEVPFTKLSTLSFIGDFKRISKKNKRQ